ncbi:MAG: DNA/RNA non-specific endonuclease [Bacteroidaceae bacterium]|nr:DNA/RNA non-specific endonuclease [Bacteroidaceae bacterium]
MKRYLNKLNIFLVVLAVAFASCSSDDDAVVNGGGGGGVKGNLNANSTEKCRYANRMEFPALKDSPSSMVLFHTTGDKFDSLGVNYCTEWDTCLMSQRWSCYQLHTGYSVLGVNRYDTKSNGYPFDPALKTGETYLGRDYFYGSGFDHGHICPSASRTYSETANYQTFYLTNMQPQYNNFNAHIWADLENQIRRWATAKGVVNMFICKGGTIDSEDDIMMRISGKLIVPRYFFAALLVQNSLGYKAIGFWFEHKNVNESGTPLRTYAVSVDELEKRTGIDFFCNLPDNVENDRESRCDLAAWGLN